MPRARSSLGLFVIAISAVAACGGGGGTTDGQGAKTASTQGSPDEPLAGATVYDEVGQSHQCEIPKNTCGAAKEPPREFKDQCALKGFRIVQCGCDQRCTGNAMAERLHYDANNVGKLCAKAKEGCEPPETSASFQDACSAVGGKFVVCGCEWLCTDKLKGAVPAKPPAAEDEPPAEAGKSTEGDAAQPAAGKAGGAAKLKK
jgi:hypothetical protein